MSAISTMSQPASRARATKLFQSGSESRSECMHGPPCLSRQSKPEVEHKPGALPQLAAHPSSVGQRSKTGRATSIGPDHRTAPGRGQHHDAECDAIPGEGHEAVAPDGGQQPAHAEPGAHAARTRPHTE